MNYYRLFSLLILIVFFFKLNTSLLAETKINKNLSCITILTIASEQSKSAGEGEKHKKLLKLKESFLVKYPLKDVSEKEISASTDEHKKAIEDKGKRYINKWLQKCGLK